jgi:Arc/MetJ-type ribon-helix-helix transcriptional regulator
MDHRQKIRELLESMDAAGREALSQELLGMNAPAATVGLDEITVERLSDTGFAARVRAEIQAALRGEI